MANRDPALTARFDELLMMITQQAGDGIHGLLDAVYSFLQRRTDFFYEAEPGDKMGFPPKFAESLTYQFFKKWQDEHEKKFPSKGDALAKRWDEFKKKQIEKTEQKVQSDKEAKIENKDDSKIEEVKEVAGSAAKTVPKKNNVRGDVEEQSVSMPVPKKAATESSIQVDKSISTHNGAKTDKYNWSQSIKNVDVQIPLPHGTTAKELLVIIKAKHLKVTLKKNCEVIMDGELCEKVKPDESFWSIEDKQFLSINFEKSTEVIWKCILLGDDEIDTKKVDNSKNLDQFDNETQGHLRKVLYEQERKRQGLPTTEEAKNYAMMEEIMKKQGAANPQNQLPYDANLYKRTDGTSAPVSPFAAPMQ